MPRALSARAATVALAILAALTVAVVAPTSAIGKTTCRVSLTSLSAPVKVVSGNPPLNGIGVRAGTVDGKVCGRALHGAERLTIAFAGPGKASTVTGTIFGPQGSIRFTGTVLATPQPNGSFSLKGTGGKATGGTGLYKGATGRLSVTGTQPARSNVKHHVHDRQDHVLSIDGDTSARASVT